jgi:hypothetical protein
MKKRNTKSKKAEEIRVEDADGEAWPQHSRASCGRKVSKTWEP